MLTKLCFAAVLAVARADESLNSGFLNIPLERNSLLTAYLARVFVGTPPQAQTLKIDTGSPTYSFLNPRNPFCSGSNRPCEATTTFDNLTSSTSEYQGPGFSTQLIDHGSGDYLQDQVSIGGKLLPSAYFGYVNLFPFASNVQTPATTIGGMSLIFSKEGANDTTPEPWLLPQLKDANLIDKLAVGFYLGPDQRNNTGAHMILGGAYDRAKFDGAAFTVPMVDPYSQNLSGGQTNSVNVTSIESVIGGNITNATFGEESFGHPVLMDTGSPLWYIPEPIFDRVYEKLGQPTEQDRNNGYYIVDCEVRRRCNDDEDYVTVHFGAAGKIKVPISRVITDFGDGSCGAFVGNGGPELTRAFGDSFLRSTYIIFDQEELTVTFAQVKYTDAENIVALPA